MDLNQYYCISSSKYIVSLLQSGADEKVSGGSADVDPPKQVKWWTVYVYVCEDSSIWGPRTFSQLPLYEPSLLCKNPASRSTFARILSFSLLAPATNCHNPSLLEML